MHRFWDTTGTSEGVARLAAEAPLLALDVGKWAGAGARMLPNEATATGSTNVGSATPASPCASVTAAMPVMVVSVVSVGRVSLRWDANVMAERVDPLCVAAGWEGGRWCSEPLPSLSELLGVSVAADLAPVEQRLGVATTGVSSVIATARDVIRLGCAGAAFRAATCDR